MAGFILRHKCLYDGTRDSNGRANDGTEAESFLADCSLAGNGTRRVERGGLPSRKAWLARIAEFEAAELFDVDHVDVKDGVLRTGRRPRNRFYLWTDEHGERDIVIFLGEAQPPLGKYSFCRQLAGYAKEIGTERLFTFAAKATQMHPEHPSRVFAAGTDKQVLEELRTLDLEVLEDGQISGLNGLLLGAAAEAGLSGACLLGEVPHILSQLPFPKASLAILDVFSNYAKLSVDLSELAEKAHQTDEQLGELLARVEEAYGPQFEPANEEEYASEPEEEEKLSQPDYERMEELLRPVRAGSLESI